MSKTDGKPKEPSTAPSIAAPKKNAKPKRAHDRWAEYETFVNEFKASNKNWPTLEEAIPTLQKRRKLASDNDWAFVAKHYVAAKNGKDRVTSEVAESGLQLALQTLENGRMHSIYLHHPKEVEAYAKKTGKAIPESTKPKESKKGGK